MSPDFPAFEVVPVPRLAAVSIRTPIPVVDGKDLYVIFTYPLHEADMQGYGAKG